MTRNSIAAPAAAPPLASCLYEGNARHRRFWPKAHAFSYRFFMVYLDLAELPTLFRGRWLWSATRPAIARFRREDYFGDPAKPLDEAVRDRVESESGTRPSGPIRLLTHLRYFGYLQNPVSFYYCFDARGERVESILAEITNTPWGERHAYVLHPGNNESEAAGRHRRRFAKAFHVSPFMEMEQTYDWRFADPGAALSVHMENFQKGERIFDATLTMRRRTLNGPALARALAVYPFLTLKVAFGIYWQAARLWLKGVPAFVHPAKRGEHPKEANR
jgi:DUF1365 family protein